jgi:hypothetical protein
MSSTTSPQPALRDRLVARWEGSKPVVFALVGGLVAGPILSGMLGYQVRSSTAATALHDSIVEQQAMFCQERARAALPADAGRIDWNRGYDLAKTWSVMPGAAAGAEPDPAVRLACARRLAS